MATTFRATNSERLNEIDLNWNLTEHNSWTRFPASNSNCCHEIDCEFDWFNCDRFLAKLFIDWLISSSNEWLIDWLFKAL
jgi:hypothetical protein